MSPILVTGSAGFIGFHLCKRLIEEGFEVIGLDNLNNYYEVNLKKDRVKQIQNFSARYKNRWQFIEGDLQNKKLLEEIFNKVNMSKNKEENITFEQAIEELENIINRLEEGDVPLDETIKLYEKGSELKDFCEKKLQSAEVKIQKINQKTKTKEITIEDYK